MNQNVDSRQVDLRLSGRQFRMAGRARSAAVFRPGEQLNANYELDGSHISLALTTRYHDKGFEDRVPGDLWLDARGPAPDLHRAIATFSSAGREVASVVALVANASIAPIEPELIYDATPGASEREFFQRFVPDEPLNVVSSRFVPVPATGEVGRAIALHPDRERIMRAVGQYSVALDHWSLGSELLAISHLFMGAEALKTACWRHAARVSNKSLEGLATKWGHDPERRMTPAAYVEEQARVRLVFAGDMECHRKAKDISDAFEHGFENPGALFDPAREILVKTAQYVRQAIFSVLELTDETRRVLDSDRYSRPRGPPKLEAFLYATLVNAADETKIAADGNEYPIFRWSRELSFVKYEPETDTYGFKPTEQITALFAPGVEARLGRHEIWDGATIETVDDAALRKQAESK